MKNAESIAKTIKRKYGIDQVDYAIVAWYENMDLDIELSKCGELLYTNDVYKLYKFEW